MKRYENDEIKPAAEAAMKSGSFVAVRKDRMILESLKVKTVLDKIIVFDGSLLGMRDITLAISELVYLET